MEFTDGSGRGVRDGPSLISALTCQIQCFISGIRNTLCGFFGPSEAPVLHLSSSEELDVVSFETRDLDAETLKRHYLSIGSYLSPKSVSTLKSPTLPIKPLRAISELVSKTYLAAGQAMGCR